MSTFGVFVATILFGLGIGAIGLTAAISSTRELRRRAEAEKAHAAKS
jgi:hypothetical protein